MEYNKKRMEYMDYKVPGWDRMCNSGCPRTKNMKTELIGEARREKFGGPKGYFGI